MILRRHVPAPPLSGFVDFFWFFEGWDGSHPMEHVLPDGAFELVINLREGPRKLFDRHDLSRCTSFRRGWISGAHSQYIVIDTMPGASMIGAHFKPGGAAPFLGFPAAEFQDRVVEFDAIWGSRAVELRDRLLAAPGPSAKFALLEMFLAAKLARRPANGVRRDGVAWATAQFCRQPEVQSIGAAARHLGMSHKHFIDQFRRQVGLAPKLFCRIRRFQGVLAQVNCGRPVDWAEVACECGYYDQAHFINDFHAFSGLNPSAYRSLGDDYASFVPIGEGR